MDVDFERWKIIVSTMRRCPLCDKVMLLDPRSDHHYGACETDKDVHFTVRVSLYTTIEDYYFYNKKFRIYYPNYSEETIRLIDFDNHSLKEVLGKKFETLEDARSIVITAYQRLHNMV